MAQSKDQNAHLELSGTWHVPDFADVTDVTEAGDVEKSFVISNTATGRYFLGNAAAVLLLQNLRDTGHVAGACSASGLSPEAAGPVLKRFIDFGLVVRAGETRATEHAPKTPLESRMIMMRLDLFDVSSITTRLSLIGRAAYARLGVIFWIFAVGAMLFQLLDNSEKLRVTLMRVSDNRWVEWAVFAALIVALKLIHEFGHAFAYREMMQREGLDPGPIRTGICIFAFTPFPYTDVSAAWRLRSRIRRVIIGAGGIYFETWAIAALTTIWAQTQAGLFQTAALQVAAASGALALLFNLNPAVKLDGYFMLTDWLRIPNLAARASVAARSAAARALGATIAKPHRGELAYWALSYLYRWVIFAGIFWLVYQVDPRLGPVFAAIIVMMLILRPIRATAAFVKATDAKLWRSVGLVCAVIGAAILAFVPWQGRVLVDAQIVRFDTRVVTVTEAGWLRRSNARVFLENPDLRARVADLAIERDLLELVARAQFSSATEQARLRSDLAANAQAQDQMQARLAQLDLGEAIGHWTDLGAKTLEDVWLTPRAEPIAAVSTPTPLSVSLTIDQRRLPDAAIVDDMPDVTLRARNNTDCTFAARPAQSGEQALAADSLIRLRATPLPSVPTCVDALPHGAALVAYVATEPASLVDRVWLLASRTLQDRLDINRAE